MPKEMVTMLTHNDNSVGVCLKPFPEAYLLFTKAVEFPQIISNEYIHVLKTRI